MSLGAIARLSRYLAVGKDVSCDVLYVSRDPATAQVHTKILYHLEQRGVRVPYVCLTFAEFHFKREIPFRIACNPNL